ncbi:MAG: carbohydrate binding domain-containing protein, partial [Patescibacteria group bacterium]
MNRYVRWIVSQSLLLQPLGLLFLTPHAFSADPVNLVSNPSLETGNTGNTAPLNWLSNKWGTNGATFVYNKTEGYQGTRSVRVNMSQYTNGDAKWYFNPVTIQPNTDYTFTDYYKSSVPTVIVAASFDAANNPTYQEVATNVVASSTAWKQVTVKIRTPANGAKLTVFHLINRNGWLQLDAASLTAGAPPLPTVLPPNGSLEQAAGTVPQDWAKEGWGSNTRTFAYPNEGHTGTKSVKVTVSNYTDGDAKWAFKPLALPAAKDYRFSAWYKTNTQPHVVARFMSNNGTTETYHGMPNPEAPTGSNTTWQFYSDTFYVPPGTEEVTVFMFVSSNGWVQTDDYSITPYTPVGLNQGMVSLTFDDGFEENNTTVLPRLNSFGFKTTYCY